ncbi:PAS domain S-box-containing protein [Desulfobaculum xiamenense]|uniref:PAS domain S-box-containing protein n=1 Tax=Desulfobaculum xiamenense TaxID=995050 RepID=A0A846QMT8_9BACT|nr:PAS domain S-box protein [Desulfobaculum xiamenense]NJB67782.1 PAS domain S-box-containing protein [Desulfobaculum xiamenense]
MQNTTLRILLANPNPNDTALISQALAEAGFRFHIETAANDDALRRMLGDGPDLIIRRDADAPLRNLIPATIPVIVISNTMTHERGRELVESGAHDYMHTSDIGRLPASASRALRDAALRRASTQSPLADHFAQAYRHSLDAVAMLDIEEHVVDINAAFTRLFGFSIDEMRGRRLSDCIMPQDRREEFMSLTARVQNGEMIRRRTTRLRKDASPVEVIAIGVPVTLADGNHGICAIYSDISPREKAIRALRQAESRYRSFFMEAVEGMFISTPTGRFMLANPALAELLGYESVSAVTDGIRNISREVYADASQRDRLLELLGRHGAVRDFRTRVVRRDGTVITVRQNVREVRDEDGELLYYQGTMALTQGG